MNLLSLDEFREVLENKGIDMYKCNGKAYYKDYECTEYELLGKERTTVYVDVRL